MNKYKLRKWLYHIKDKLNYVDMDKNQKEAFKFLEKKFLTETKHIKNKTFNYICFIFGKYWLKETYTKYEIDIIKEANNILKEQN